MKLALKVWLPIGWALALVCLVYLIADWSSMSATHRLSFVAVIAIVLHMTEEERLPGGFAYMYNVLARKSDVPDRYPMSPVIVMAVDVLGTTFLFLPALFFPDLIWLGMAPMFLGLVEMLMHTGVIFAIQLRRKLGFYDPGLLTALVLGAVSITYVSVVVSDGLMSGLDWLWAFLYFAANMVLFVIVPENFFSSRTTQWAFSHDHLLGYYKRYTTIEEVLGTAPAQDGAPPAQTF